MELLGRGRDCDVYAAGEGLVLRRYRDGRPAREEAATLVALHGLGYPVPRLHDHDGADLIMERVAGPTLAQGMFAGSTAPVAGGRLLADLHDRLHALSWPGGPLVHLDLHPFNVLMGETGPVVIDWSNARTGEPALDVALSALILAQVVVTPGLLAAVEGTDPAADELHRAMAKELLGAFVTSTTTSYLSVLTEATERRRGDRYQSATELERLDEAATLVRDPNQTGGSRT